MSMHDIIEDALILTGRYDLQQPQMQVLVKQVARQVSLSGKWGEDYIEVTKEFDAPSPLQSIPVSELGFVVYESVLAILPDGSPVQLEQMLPRHILGSVGTSLAQNSYYSTSQSLEMSCTYPFQTAYVGGYHADIGNENYWMYTTIPEIITAGLSAQIYRLLGEVESFSMYETEFQRLLAIFKANRADLGTRAPTQINIRCGEQPSGGVVPGPGPGPVPSDGITIVMLAGSHLEEPGIGYFPGLEMGGVDSDILQVGGQTGTLVLLVYDYEAGELVMSVDNLDGITAITLSIEGGEAITLSSTSNPTLWMADLAESPFVDGQSYRLDLHIEVGEGTEPVPVPEGAHSLTAGVVGGDYIGFFASEGVGTLDPDVMEVMGDDYNISALYYGSESEVPTVFLELENLPTNVEIHGGTLTVGNTVLSEFSGVDFWENLTIISWQAPGALWVPGQKVFVTVELDAREYRPEPTFNPTHFIVPEEFEYQGWSVIGFSYPEEAGSLDSNEVSIPQEVYIDGYLSTSPLKLYIDEVLFDPNGGIVLSIAEWPNYFNLVESRLWVRDQELVSSSTTSAGNTLILSWPTLETPWVAGLEEPIRLELEVEDLRWGLLSQSFTVGVGTINSEDRGYNTTTGSLTPTDQITIGGGEYPIVRLSMTDGFAGKIVHLHVGTDDDFNWGPHGRDGWSVEVDGIIYPATGHSWGNPATIRFHALDAANWLAGTEKVVTIHQYVFTPQSSPPQ